MADWVRSLFHVTGVPLSWHARKSSGYSTTTSCGLTIEGPLEIARPDRVEREAHCPTCAEMVSLSRNGPATPAKVVAKAAPRTSRPRQRLGAQTKRRR